MYEAAVATLSALNANWVEEVRSFRQPPQPVQFLGCALCLLFKKPQSCAFVSSSTLFCIILKFLTYCTFVLVEYV